MEAKRQEPVDAQLGGGGERPRVEDHEVRRRGADVVDDYQQPRVVLVDCAGARRHDRLADEAARARGFPRQGPPRAVQRHFLNALEGEERLSFLEMGRRRNVGVLRSAALAPRMHTGKVPMYAFCTSAVRHGPCREIDGRQPEERPPGVVVAEQQARIEAAARRVEAIFGPELVAVERARRDFDAIALFFPRVRVVEDDRRVACVEIKQ